MVSDMTSSAGTRMIGIATDNDGFELVCGDKRIGTRRHLDVATVSNLTAYAQRYAKLLERGGPAAELLALGRELFHFLDGSGRDLAALIEAAPRPLHFEIA